jgi:hypothetical protein
MWPYAIAILLFLLGWEMLAIYMMDGGPKEKR